jgi:hypothetical protein
VADCHRRWFDGAEVSVGCVSVDKELYVIDDGMHFDFYDRPEYVGPAVNNDQRVLHQPSVAASRGVAGSLLRPY